MGNTPQEYWGHLVDPEKKNPSPRLEALLNGIAHYIIKNIEPREHHVLTPPKLAAFYRSVGGDYDKFFLETSSGSLSFVYQALGCYHSLQPDSDPFKPPTIPALTASGFRRWQTIQLLLEPAQQVPLLQEAVSRYDIANKADGHIFPKILPAECLPREPDPYMVKWHDDSLQRLKREADMEAAAKANATAYPHPSPNVGGPAMGSAQAREYEGSPWEESDSGPEDGGDKSYFSIARLKRNVASRWDAFRGDSRPSSREGRDPRDRERERERDRDRDRDRERRRRGPDEGGNIGRSGSYRYQKRPTVDDTGRRQSHPGHQFSGDYTRGARTRTFQGQDYDGQVPPGDAGYDPRMRNRPQYSARGPPLSPGLSDNGRDRDRDRDRDRGYTSADHSPRSGNTPPLPSRPPVTRNRLSSDRYARRHSAHEPASPREAQDSSDYIRARSRSHNGRSPNERLSPSDAYAPKSARPSSTFIPPGGQGISQNAPNPFARGNLRHSMHSPGQSPYRGREGPDGSDDPRMSAGVRYIPAERSRRADRV